MLKHPFQLITGSKLILLYVTSLLGLSALTEFAVALDSFPIVQRTSNSKVQLTEVQSTGLLTMDVDLYWTYQGAGGSHSPDSLALVFEAPAELDPEFQPVITHSYLDDSKVEFSAWLPDRTFRIPLPKKLYSGTKLHLTFSFKYKLKELLPNTILTHFFPKIPIRYREQWLIPSEHSVIYPYGTCHITTASAVDPILIPNMYRRGARENMPPAVNGCSIAFSQDILESFVWNGIKIDHSKKWLSKDLAEGLKRVSQKIGFQTLTHITLIKGAKHAGWGLCSFERLSDMEACVFEMILKMFYPLVSSPELNPYEDMARMMVNPRSKHLFSFNLTPTLFNHHSNCSRFYSYFSNLSKQKQIRLFDDWIARNLCKVKTLDDILGLENSSSAGNIHIEFKELSEEGYVYAFNPAARLCRSLILETATGRFFQRKNPRQAIAVYPDPVVKWHQGFTFPLQGTVAHPKNTVKQALEKNRKRERLWQNVQWLWFQ